MRSVLAVLIIHSVSPLLQRYYWPSERHPSDQKKACCLLSERRLPTPQTSRETDVCDQLHGDGQSHRCPTLLPPNPWPADQGCLAIAEEDHGTRPPDTNLHESTRWWQLRGRDCDWAQKGLLWQADRDFGFLITVSQVWTLTQFFYQPRSGWVLWCCSLDLSHSSQSCFFFILLLI